MLQVWTGAMAKDLGLVDELGGIDKALNAAATQAGIEITVLSAIPKKKIFSQVCWAIRKNIM